MAMSTILIIFLLRKENIPRVRLICFTPLSIFRFVRRFSIRELGRMSVTATLVVLMNLNYVGKVRPRAMRC
jgi:hypothetical protein